MSALAKATELSSPRKPKPLARSPRRFQRPTLSAQLAKIGRQAEQVTAALSASFELARHDDALLLLYDPRDCAHVVRVDLHLEHDAKKIADYLAPRCAGLRIVR